MDVRDRAGGIAGKVICQDNAVAAVFHVQSAVNVWRQKELDALVRRMAAFGPTRSITASDKSTKANMTFENGNFTMD